MSVIDRTEPAYERFLGATIASHPEQSLSWCEATAYRALWFVLFDGDMARCPDQLTDEPSSPVGSSPGTCKS
jgi:hypothetical protein